MWTFSKFSYVFENIIYKEKWYWIELYTVTHSEIYLNRGLRKFFVRFKSNTFKLMCFNVKHSSIRMKTGTVLRARWWKQNPSDNMDVLDISLISEIFILISLLSILLLLWTYYCNEFTCLSKSRSTPYFRVK